jgi:DNA-binding NtrC family response regulator
MKNLKKPIYIIDDEKDLLDSLRMTLNAAGFEKVECFSDGRQVLKMLPVLDCSLLLLDLNMPGGISGENILEQFRAECPDIPVVIITGVDDTAIAVRCMKTGAFDYLVKPLETDILVTTVKRAFNHSMLLRQNINLRRKLIFGQLDRPEAFEHIITANQQIQSIFRYLEVIGPASDPVLITGETGTGKSLIAESLHKVSARDGAFVNVNIAGLDDNMLADTLFGHRKGAFTGADTSRKGMVELAANGTLFLDEIGDLSLVSQVKLLQLIQDGEYQALGEEIPRRSKARIVLATNQDMKAIQQKGRFRKDLYFRISTYHVNMPPLRERPEDILLLASHYLDKACEELNLNIEKISPRLADLLLAYDYPGNVRELRAMMYDAIAHGGLDTLQRKLAGRIKNIPKYPGYSHPQEIQYPDPLPTLEDTAQSLIKEALKRSKGNQAAAARMLGISRQALHQRVKQKEAC